MVQHGANQAGIAVNISTDLQHRRAAVATRQRHEVGLGHDHGNGHALP